MTAHNYYPALADTPWPMFQHDTRHTGCSPYIGPQTAHLKWTFNLPELGATNSPAIAGDGTLYVWACHRRVPYVKIGRLTKFDLKDLERWINARKVETKNF